MNRLILLFLLFTISCNTSRELLSDDEKRFRQQLQEDCGCEVELAHDDFALQNDNSTGTFEVTFINSSVYYCNSDSSELARISGNIAKRLAVVMSNKKNYSNIRFTYLQISKEEITCTRHIMIRRP
ncbi:hypothetical protein [Chitinophaga sp. YIM B06452]|uniref:hypothetical protein n=1 Tax=Chitinophaga sp. YIM B06452 TaxID=3082158 RepID=UPI0031FF23CA